MELLYSNRIPANILQVIKERSLSLSLDPNWIIFLMDIESGLDPYAINSYGCFSYIQFCPDNHTSNSKTINGINYQFSDLKQMSPNQLMNISFDYIKQQQRIYGRFYDYYNLYFSILYPLAINKPDSYIINTKTNDIFDLNNNGEITVAEVKKYLDNKIKQRVPKEYWNNFFKKKTFYRFTDMKSYLFPSLQV